MLIMAKNLKFYDGIAKKGKLSLKKTLPALVVAGALLFSATPVYAHVDDTTIIGDINVAEDRTATRVAEAEAIDRLFSNQTNRVINVETVEHALELSDVLNGFNPGPNEYSNTSYNEIANFDLDGKYFEYIGEANRGNVDQFCANNMTNEAVIDAYTLFGCETVKNGLLAQLSNIAQSRLNVNNRSLSSVPHVGYTDNGVFLVFNYQGQMIKVDLVGNTVDEVIANITDLMNHYNIAMDNMAGRNNEYENSFAYQGAYTGGTDSAYFSAGDDYRKEDIRRSIDLYYRLQDTNALEINAYFAKDDRSLTPESRDLLRTFGYSEQELDNFAEIDMVVSGQPQITFGK